MNGLKTYAYELLRRSEKVFKTDMVYLAKGGFWLSAAQAVSTLSAFVLSVAFANLLIPNDYGVYKYVLSIATLLTIPAMGGIDTSLIQAVTRGYEGTIHRSRQVKFRYGLLGGLGSLLVGGYYSYQGNFTLGASFLIAGIFLPFMESLSLYTSFLQGRKDFKTSSIYSALIQIVSATTLLITLIFTRSIPLLVLAYFTAWTLCRFILMQKTLKKVKDNELIDEDAIAYGKHLTFMSALGVVANYIDRLLVFQYVGAAGLAMYTIATAAPEQIKGFTKNISNLAFPKFTEQNLASLQASLLQKLLRLGLVLALIIVAYVLSAPFLFHLLFPQYLEAILLSQLFAISLITAPSSIIITALQAQGATKELYKINTQSSVVQITSLFFAVIFWGILGVIIARIVTRFFILAISLKYFYSSKTTL